MLLLKQIKLSNFISHSNTAIDFKPECKIILSGKSGSGKSSIVESLIFGFYGDGRTDKLSLIKKETTNASVIIILEDNETKQEFKIERTIDSKNKHELKVYEKEKGKKFLPIKAQGIKEIQDYLETKILHSSYLLFINSIMYPQSNTESFVLQTASKKKDILLEIINASSYDEYLKKTKEKLTTIKTDKEVSLAKIEDRQNEIKNNKETADRLKEYEDKEVIIKEEIITLKDQYKKLVDQQKEIIEKVSALKSNEEKGEEKLKLYESKEKRLKELNQKIIELSMINAEDIKKEIEILNKKKKEIDDYNLVKDKILEWNDKHIKILSLLPSQHDYDKDISEINKQLISAMDDSTEKCPNCGYIDPERARKRQEGISYLEELLKDVQRDQEDYKKSKEEYDIKIKELGESPVLPLTREHYEQLLIDVKKLDELNKKLIIIENANKEISEAEKEIGIINDEQLTIAKEIEEIKLLLSQKDTLYYEEKDVKDKIIKINGKIDELMMMHTNNSELLGVAKHAVKRIEKSKEELLVLEKDLNKIIEDIESLELLKDAFGPNGIKAIMIDYILPEIEDRINNVLGKLSNFRIELTTQKSGTGKDVLLEGLFINIINEVGEVMDFASYSGGERVKIVIAISEALASLSKCNFRVLDEAIVALDEESVEQFIQAMVEIQKKVNQVICISHIESIKSLFENKIEVQKINGNSTIKI